MDQVRGEIEKADILIAVCTGRNPNVFFELGYADALTHKPILVAANTEDLPFDVAHWRAHLYGGGNGELDSLAERLLKAIKETLAARLADPSVRTPPVIESPTGSTSTITSDSGAELVTMSGVTALVQRADLISYLEYFKNLMAKNRAIWETAGEENFNIQPNIGTLDDLRASRYKTVEELLAWLLPAIEYRPEWLRRPLSMLNEQFATQLHPQAGGFIFWQSLHQTWAGLTLKGIIAAATRVGAWAAILEALRLPPLDGTSDPAPLLISGDFTWAAGFHGNALTFFQDFATFVESSPSLSSLANGVREPIDLACGADLILALARCCWDAAPDRPASLSRRTYTYASFSAYECRRINWLARTLEYSEEAATAVGAENLNSFRVIARSRYPDLISNHEGGRMSLTCSTWEGAVGLPAVQP